MKLTLLQWVYLFFYSAMAKSRRCTVQTITGAVYADSIALLANTPAQAEFLQYSLEWAAVAIGLYVNADKTEFMSFNQRGNISTLKSGLVEQVHLQTSTRD